MRDLYILLVDDHAIVRAGLRALISSQPDMTVVGEADCMTAAVTLAAALEPDVVILDLGIPGGGLAALKTIRAQRPRCRVLILTMYDDPAYMRACLSTGATGFLCKRVADAELLTALRQVHAGRAYTGVAMDTSLPSTGQGDDPPSQVAPLSKRELEVLRHVAYGYTNRQVAERLQLSAKSVETYRARVQEKLRLRGRAELVRYALGAGLVV